MYTYEGAMVNWPIVIVKGVAAGCFGAAVALLTAAAWALVRREQAARAGVGMTSIRRAEMRRQAVADSPAFGLILPLISGMAGVVSRLGLDPLRGYVHDPYVRAGYPGGLDDDEVVAAGALLSVAFVAGIALVTVGLMGFGWMWIALVGFPLGFMALVAHFKSAAKVREVEIMQALPYALDLLVLMLRSGTSLRIALLRVVEDYEGHPLGAEFGQVLAEIDVGSPRAEAFKKMAGRLKIPDITALVDALVQSEELGWPLADTLEGLADRLNGERMLRAQSTAGAAGVYVMLPSTLVLLSAVLLLFAPFIVRYLVTGTLAD